MNTKLLLSSILLLAALLASGCGSVQVPTSISIPTDLPPVVGTIIANPPATQGAASTPGVLVPSTGGGTDSQTMLLYAMLALVFVFILITLFILVNRPGNTPGPDE